MKNHIGPTTTAFVDEAQFQILHNSLGHIAHNYFDFLISFSTDSTFNYMPHSRVVGRKDCSKT